MYFNLSLGDDYIYYGSNEFYGLNTHNKLVVKKRVELLESIEPKYKFEEKKIFPEYYIITVERYKNIIQRRIDEGIELMILNSYKAGIPIELLSKIAQLSEEEVNIILKLNSL